MTNPKTSKHNANAGACRDKYVHWERKIMRLCAVGMVSNDSLDESEMNAIKDIILRDWTGEGKISPQDISFSFTSESLEDKASEYLASLYDRLKTDEDAQLGLFVDIKSLTDYQALEELRDIVYVIKADSVISETERIAFVAIAKIFKFSSIDSIWNVFFEEEKCNLINMQIKQSMYKSRRSQINVYDIGVIEKAIINYEVGGPLRLGLQSAIQRDKYDLIKHREKNHKRVSKIALVFFVVSALILYFECAKLLEYKIIANELTHECKHECKHEVHMPQPIVDIFRNDGKEVLDEECKVAAENKDSVLETSSELAECHQGYTELCCVEAGMRRSMLDGYSKAFRIVLIGVVLYLIFLVVRKIIRKIKFLYNISLPGWPLPIVLCLAVLSLLYFIIPKSVISMLCYTPFWVLCMMLSIEVMIFMRERYTEKIKEKKKESSTLLIVFVAAAVIADLCIGLIELPVGVDPIIVVNKIAFSVFLGCVSFFAGKFMEMDSIQKQVDIENMETSMKNINNYIAAAKKTKQ